MVSAYPEWKPCARYIWSSKYLNKEANGCTWASGWRNDLNKLSVYRNRNLLFQVNSARLTKCPSIHLQSKLRLTTRWPLELLVWFHSLGLRKSEPRNSSIQSQIRELPGRISHHWHRQPEHHCQRSQVGVRYGILYSGSGYSGWSRDSYLG